MYKLNQALIYNALGFKITPMTQLDERVFSYADWSRATYDPEQIERWWGDDSDSLYSECPVGVVMGEASGIWAISASNIPYQDDMLGMTADNSSGIAEVRKMLSLKKEDVFDVDEENPMFFKRDYVADDCEYSQVIIFYKYSTRMKVNTAFDVMTLVDVRGNYSILNLDTVDSLSGHWHNDEYHLIDEKSWCKKIRALAKKSDENNSKGEKS